MKFVITLGVIFLLSSCGIDDTIDGNDGDNGSSGSGWEKEWSSEGIDTLNAIAVSPDNRVYVGGLTLGDLYAVNVGIDATLAAFDSRGNEMWGKQWSVIDDENDVWGLVVDDEGNIYAGGGGHNPFIIKFSPDGTKIWEKFPDVDTVYCLALDNSGNVYAGTGYGDILKFSPEGKELWHYNISTEDAEGEIKALAVDSEGNVYAGGIAWNDLFGESAGGCDAFLVKLAPDGTHAWEKQWGGEGYDRAYSIAIDNMKNIYVGCGTDKTAEILLKFSPDGNKLWGNEGSAVNYKALALDNENNLYVGIGYNQNLVEKYTSDGEKICDTNDEGQWDWSVSGIALDSNGNLYVCGGKNENNLIKIPVSEMK